jgi:hypothetical protein
VQGAHFFAERANHVCIVPFAKARINFVKSIFLFGFRFEIDFSEKVLPQLEIGELDLLLIDGAHGFPLPFIDWYYGASKLKIGGILIIDDTQVWTGHVLKMFLSGEPEWQLVADYAPRCVVFKKIKDGGFGKNEWILYVVRRLLTSCIRDTSICAPYVFADLLEAKARVCGRETFRTVG